MQTVIPEQEIPSQEVQPIKQKVSTLRKLGAVAGVAVAAAGSLLAMNRSGENSSAESVAPQEAPVTAAAPENVRPMEIAAPNNVAVTLPEKVKEAIATDRVVEVQADPEKQEASSYEKIMEHMQTRRVGDKIKHVNGSVSGTEFFSGPRDSDDKIIGKNITLVNPEIVEVDGAKYICANAAKSTSGTGIVCAPADAEGYKFSDENYNEVQNLDDLPEETSEVMFVENNRAYKSTNAQGSGEGIIADSAVIIDAVNGQ